jgi:FMN phosphatase YigB (HAD superfamily)
VNRSGLSEKKKGRRDMDRFKAIFFDADGTIVNHKECEKKALIYLFNGIGIKV